MLSKVSKGRYLELKRASFASQKGVNWKPINALLVFSLWFLFTLYPLVQKQNIVVLRFFRFLCYISPLTLLPYLYVPCYCIITYFVTLSLRTLLLHYYLLCYPVSTYFVTMSFIIMSFAFCQQYYCSNHNYELWIMNFEL